MACSGLSTLHRKQASPSNHLNICRTRKKQGMKLVQTPGNMKILQKKWKFRLLLEVLESKNFSRKVSTPRLVQPAKAFVKQLMSNAFATLRCISGFWKNTILSTATQPTLLSNSRSVANRNGSVLLSFCKKVYRLCVSVFLQLPPPVPRMFHFTSGKERFAPFRPERMDIPPFSSKGNFAFEVEGEKGVRSLCSRVWL